MPLLGGLVALNQCDAPERAVVFWRRAAHLALQLIRAEPIYPRS
ncbi:hypothetical protein [Streptomyces sp. WZ-12]|nr:hypothetical protein [Streptomyces sp. WZ-12]